MKSFLVLMATLSALVLLGCTSVVTSETPIKLSPIDKYLVLDGLPYFLPKSMIHIDITWSKDEYNWIVNVKPVIQPDNKSPRFILRTDSNALFDDDITLAVDPNGILQTVNVSMTDKTVSSIADLAAAAGNAFTFGAGLPSGAGGLLAPPLTPPPPFPSSHHRDYDLDQNLPDQHLPDINLQTPPLTIKVMVDKRDSNGHLVKDENGNPIKEPQDIPAQYSTKFTLKFTPQVTAGTTPIQRTDISPDAYPLRGIVEASPENGSIHGIVVRTPVPYEINITVNDDATQSQSTILLVSDVKQNYILPINRRYLVQDKTNVTLKDGMIQSIQKVRPSMVAGVVGIPKTILGALVPIPLQIRQSQTNNLQAIDNSLKAKADIKKLQSQ